MFDRKVIEEATRKFDEGLEPAQKEHARQDALGRVDLQKEALRAISTTAFLCEAVDYERRRRPSTEWEKNLESNKVAHAVADVAKCLMSVATLYRLDFFELLRGMIFGPGYREQTRGQDELDQDERSVGAAIYALQIKRLVETGDKPGYYANPDCENAAKAVQELFDAKRRLQHQLDSIMVLGDGEAKSQT